MGQKTDTIGAFARHKGIASRKIRFYADAGLLFPDRTAAQYRIFDDGDLVVFELIRSLRAVEASLASIRAVLNRDASLRELLAMRLTEVEASLRRQKALAAPPATAPHVSSPTISDILRLSQMIGYSQAQRHVSANTFFDALTNSVQFASRWRDTMHGLIAAPELPDEPTADQIDAWLTVNKMLADGRLQRLLRAQAIDTGRTIGCLKVRDELDAWRARQDVIMEQVRSAMRQEMPVGPAEGERLADAYIAFMGWNRGLSDGEAFRVTISDMWLENGLIERFWHFATALNGG